VPRETAMLAVQRFPPYCTIPMRGVGKLLAKIERRQELPNHGKSLYKMANICVENHSNASQHLLLCEQSKIRPAFQKR